MLWFIVILIFIIMLLWCITSKKRCSTNNYNEGFYTNNSLAQLVADMKSQVDKRMN